MGVSQLQLFDLVNAVYSSVTSPELVLVVDPALDHLGSLRWMTQVPLSVGADQRGDDGCLGVVIGVPEATGIDLAAEMFARLPVQLTEADIQDAVGEIANMVADGVRALSGSEQSIGLPVVMSKSQLIEQLKKCEIAADLYALAQNQQYVYVAVVDCSKKMEKVACEF